MNIYVLELVLVSIALFLGPWLGIVVDRVVERERLLAQHRCIDCKSKLDGNFYIPVFNWFQKCSSCSKSSFRRYFWVDLCLLISFVAFGYSIGFSLVLIPYLIFACIMSILAVVDAETYLLPNIIVWPTIFVSYPLLICFSFFTSGTYLLSAVVGSLAFFIFLFVLFLINPKGMGLGDVKLAIILGLYIGWRIEYPLESFVSVLYAILLASLVGGLSGWLFNKIKKRDNSEIPFGPFLIASSLLVIIAS